MSRRRPLEGGRFATAGENGWVRGANPRLWEHGAAGAARTGAIVWVPAGNPLSKSLAA